MIIVLIGPSGVGKTSIARFLCASYQKFMFSVSITDRPKSSLEVEGQDYYFVSPKNFSAKIQSNALIEYTSIYNNRYGTDRVIFENIIESGHIAICDIDAQGAYNFRQAYKQQCYIFLILPPSIEILHQRIQSRNRDNHEEILYRENRAQQDIADAQKICDYTCINHTIKDTSDQISKIFFNAYHDIYIDRIF